VLIAVICQSEGKRALIRAALPAGSPIEYVSDVRWLGVQHLPDVLVVWPNDTVQAEHVALRFPDGSAGRQPPPMVLVCDGSPRSLALAVEFRADGLVDGAEVRTRLWREIARVRSVRILGELEESTLSRVRFQRQLSSALTYAIHADLPIRSVKELARDVGCHRTTLSKEWRLAVRRSPILPPRLEDLLSRVLLAWALVLHRPDRSWAWVAESLGVHPQTLHRAMKRMQGVDVSTSRPESDDLLIQRWRALVGIRPREATKDVESRQLVR
jgi:transposase-like protein